MDEERNNQGPGEAGQLLLWPDIRPLQPGPHRTMEQLTDGQRTQREGYLLRGAHNAEKRGHGPRRHNQPTGTGALYYGD